MKMMPGASFVLLFGLTALTQIASADDKVLHKYIVKPTAMATDDAKKSHAAEYMKFKEKYQEMVVKADEARIEVEKAQKAFDEWNDKLIHGAVVDTRITEVQKAVDGGTILQTKIKEVLSEVGEAANLSDEDWETLKTKLKAKAEEKPKDVNQDVWTDVLKIIQDHVEDDLMKDKTTVKAALDKYQKKVDTDLSKYKDALKEETDFKADYEENYVKFEKADAAQVNWKTTDADAIKKLKGWAIAIQKANADLAEKQAAQTKAEQAERYQTKDGKGVMVDDVPEAGGMEYWKKQMDAEYGAMVQDQDLAKKDDVDNGYKVLGFHNDVHGTDLLISSKLELEDLKEFFQHTIPATDGYKEETHVWATLEQDDKAVPSVTIDSYLKIQNDVVARNNHMGTITRLELILEDVTSSRPKKENKAAKDKPEDWQPIQVTTTKDGKDVKRNKEESVHKLYLNLQLLRARVYDHHDHISGHGGHEGTWSNADLVRQSKDFEILGDMTDLSAVQAISQADSSSGEGKDGGSNTWMIVAIIFIVIVVLGGLYLGYQAYNASGSLQNTDI